MAQGGQEQTVPIDKLDKKVGHVLVKGETFQTPTGCWKVVDIGRNGANTYTVERINDT